MPILPLCKRRQDTNCRQPVETTVLEARADVQGNAYPTQRCDHDRFSPKLVFLDTVMLYGVMDLGRSKFETDLQVRPDDIDMNQHVHASRYYDYVLAARYDQMARCYRMSLEEFLKAGYAWFVRSAHLDYKRPLGLGDWCTVRTWVEELLKDTVRVRFEIVKKANGKMVCDGYFDYTMVSTSTGRAESIPDWIVEKYRI